MTIEQLLSVPCKHGNMPKLVEVEPRETWRAQCGPCKCGHRSALERAPIWAAHRWYRASHANAPADRPAVAGKVRR